MKKMLAFFGLLWYYTQAVGKPQAYIRVWRSLVSRLNGVQEAAGTNPVTRTRKKHFERSAFFTEAFPLGTRCRYANDVTSLMMCCFATVRNASHYK